MQVCKRVDEKGPWGNYGARDFFESNIFYQGKKYLLVFCLEENKNYLGIIHCYRDGK